MRTKIHRAAYRASIDHLEDRRVLSDWGNPWPDPTHLSLSFAPDGTSDAGQTSALFQTLQSTGTASVWEKTILRAFQTWASYANVSIGVKADGAQPFGTPGSIQGDSRFGDIRIGAVSQAPGVLAVTQPFSYDAGSWAGDMNFNSADILSLNGQANTEDLYTLALHEAGHSFGLPDNNNPNSIMFKNYNGAKTGLFPSDIAAIQSLYGARPSDTEPNVWPWSPTWITPASPDGSNINAANVLINDTIVNGFDQHNYAFVSPSFGSFNIDLTTSGYSSFEGKITATDWQGNVVGSTVAKDPTTGNLVLSLPNSWPGSMYHFTVQSGSSDVFGIGNYSVRVVPASLSLANATTYNTTSNTTTNPNPGNSVGLPNPFPTVTSTVSATTSLVTQTTSLNSVLYSSRGSITASDPSDNYKFNTPTSGTQNVLTVSVASLDSSGLTPAVAITDVFGHTIASQVIENEAGLMVLQVPNTPLWSTYAVKVASGVTSGAGSTGNYSLLIGFGSIIESPEQVATGTLAPAPTTSATTWTAASSASLTTPVNGIVHFGLNVNTNGVDQNTSVLFLIVDSNGDLVKYLNIRANRAGSLELWLNQGIYTLEMIGINSGSASPVPMNWTLTSSQLCDPMLSSGYTGGGSSTTTYPPGQQPPPPPPPAL